MNTIAEMRGQETARRMIQVYLKSSVLPPLLIFHGPEGTGRLSAAEAFVRQRLCAVGTACGECVSCRKILGNNHPDVIRFPEAKTLIGEMREPDPFTVRWLLQERLRYAPNESAERFVIFPRADLILHEAETALLKTLEEPPEHTRFIFVVRDLMDLKPTVISRGVCVPFQHLPLSVVSDMAQGLPDLPLAGGSLAHVWLMVSDEYRLLRAKVEEALENPMALLEFEKWVESAEFRDMAEKLELPDNDLLELMGTLLLLLGRAKTAAFRDIAEAVFQFKEDLHRDMSGLEPYLLHRLFHRIMTALFPRR
ncbi:MAG: hypothetical protein HY042_05685 [Spirochaetia bacterium]|nr:hypothetical protein [Spirochaetia bacterium]